MSGRVFRYCISAIVLMLGAYCQPTLSQSNVSIHSFTSPVQISGVSRYSWPEMAVTATRVHIIFRSYIQQDGPVKENLPYVRSDDGGHTFRGQIDLGANLSGIPPYASIVASGQDVYVFVADSVSTTIMMRHSGNDGETWDNWSSFPSMGTGLYRAGPSAVKGDTLVFVAGTSAMFTSTNKGADWHRAMTLYPDSTNFICPSIAITDGGRIHAVGGGYYFRSRDFGKSWDSPIPLFEPANQVWFASIAASAGGANEVLVSWTSPTAAGYELSSRSAVNGGDNWLPSSKLGVIPDDILRSCIQGNIRGIGYRQRYQGAFVSISGSSIAALEPVQLTNWSYFDWWVPVFTAASQSSLHVVWPRSDDGVHAVIYYSRADFPVLPTLTRLSSDVVTFRQNGAERTISIHNEGDNTLSISEIRFTDPHFHSSIDTLVVAAHDSAFMPFTMSMEPGSSSLADAYAVVYCNAPNSPLLVRLTPELFRNSFSSGWHMFSAPAAVGSTQNLPASLFSWDGSFLPSAGLEAGKGYWGQFTVPSEVEFAGEYKQSLQIPVHNGWNMVGSVISAVRVEDISGLPADLSTSPYYAFDSQTGSYFVDSLIQPGSAHWVKVDQDGYLLLNQQGTFAKNRIVLNSEPPPSAPAGAVVFFPKVTKLNPSYPNPFNPTTTITYDLSKDGFVSLKVYNILGQEVATLVNGEEKAGTHSVQFDGTRLGSGVYFCTMQAPGYSQSMKLMLVR